MRLVRVSVSCARVYVRHVCVRMQHVRAYRLYRVCFVCDQCVFEQEEPRGTTRAQLAKSACIGGCRNTMWK